MPGLGGGCRAPFPRGAGWIGAGAALGVLAACSSLPDLTAALPSTAGWTRLPLESWVVEGGITAQSITACRPPDCAPAVAVGIFRATGAEAGLLEAALADPAGFERGLGRLATERRAKRRDRRNLGSRAAVAAWHGGGLKGLRITLTRDDDGRAAHGIVLARRGSEGVRAAVIAGESEAAVTEAAEGLARSGL